jgi:hypothetical protein
MYAAVTWLARTPAGHDKFGWVKAVNISARPHDASFIVGELTDAATHANFLA